MRRTLTSLTKNPCIIGDFDVAHDCVCFWRIAPRDCQEDAVTHDLRGRCHAWLGRCFLEIHYETVKKTLSHMTGSMLCRVSPWDCQKDAVTHDWVGVLSNCIMGLQKNAVTPDWVGVLSNCTVVLSRDTVLASPSLFFQLQPKNGELQMVSKIISKWKNYYH